MLVNIVEKADVSGMYQSLPVTLSWFSLKGDNA